MDIENTFENLEKIGEQNFDKAEFEKQIFDFVNQLDKIWDILSDNIVCIGVLLFNIKNFIFRFDVKYHRIRFI